MTAAILLPQGGAQALYDAVNRLAAENEQHLRVIQAESARTNEANGVIAFLGGVIAEIAKARSLEDARTFAEMAQQTIAEWHAGIWKPGPHDDAANWRRAAPHDEEMGR